MKNISKRILSVLFAAMMVFSAFYAVPELSGVLVAEAAVSKTDLSKATVKVVSSVAYNGKEQTPAVTVTVGKKTLKQGRDYTVSYSSNKAVGKAKVTVTAKRFSAYSGEKTVTFKILPAKVTGVSAVSSGKKVTVSWNAVKGADGYVVYSYNTKTKKYKKLSSVQKTSVSVKSSSSSLRFAVKAYKKVGKTTYYSAAYSSRVKAVEGPARVTSLSVSYPSKSSVKLTWKKAKKAEGYSVYYYNRELKEYVLVKNTKKTTYTLKNLDNGSYSFCVRAYLTSGSKKVHSANSPLKKATLKKAGFKIDAVNKIFESRNYQVTFSTDDPDLGESEVTFASKKNGDFAVKANIDGVSARIIYVKKTDKTYMVMLGTTFSVSDEFIGADLFSSPYFGGIKPENVTASLERVGGKLLLVNRVTDKSGNVCKYYFNGKTLVSISEDLDGVKTNVSVTSLSTSVDEKLFEYSKFAIPLSNLGV